MTLATEPGSVIQGQNRAYAWGFVIVKESETSLPRHRGLGVVVRGPTMEVLVP